MEWDYSGRMERDGKATPITDLYGIATYHILRVKFLFMDSSGAHLRMYNLLENSVCWPQLPWWQWLKKKGFPYSLPSIGPRADSSVQVVSLQLNISLPPGGRLPLLSTRPAVTFPAAEHHRLLAGTKLYCLVTEAHRCEQLAQGCYTAIAPGTILTHNMLIASPTLYPRRHRATYRYQ